MLYYTTEVTITGYSNPSRLQIIYMHGLHVCQQEPDGLLKEHKTKSEVSYIKETWLTELDMSYVSCKA